VNLVQTVFMVAVAGMLLLGGIQYVSPEAGTRVGLAAEAEVGFMQLESAFRARTAAGGSLPTVASWKTDLFPTYGRMPNAVSKLDWSFGLDGTDVWFCLSGSSTGTTLRSALDSLERRMPVGLYAVGTACGDGTGAAGSVAATLWMRRASSDAATP